MKKTSSYYPLADVAAIARHNARIVSETLRDAENAYKSGDCSLDDYIALKQLEERWKMVIKVIDAE